MAVSAAERLVNRLVDSIRTPPRSAETVKTIETVHCHHCCPLHGLCCLCEVRQSSNSLSLLYLCNISP